MPDYIDHSWYGPVPAMEAALLNQTNVIGPIVLDGIAYATVRSETNLTIPPGLSEVGPNLSRMIHGVWAGDGPHVPQIVSNFQGRTALRHAGLFNAADSIVEQMAAGMETAGDMIGAATLREAWTKASFVRSSPLVAGIAASLNLTKEEMDNLFVAASQIQV